MDKLEEMKTNNGGLLLDHHCLQLARLNPPTARSGSLDGISVENSSKLLRLSHLKSSPDQGLESAKMLDDSRAVIVSRNGLLLRPEVVVVISISMAHPNDAGRKELEEMEKQKVEIDEKAEALVRRELWCGLGFFIAQTACSIWLTFWKLSWDVMEPIVYFAACVHFLAGYIFFLRTFKALSFEGFYQSRLSMKQKQLMKKKNFDIERYKELRRAFYTSSSERPSSFDDFERKFLHGNNSSVTKFGVNTV